VTNTFFVHVYIARCNYVSIYDY